MTRRSKERPFDPDEHERMVRDLHKAKLSTLGKYALFDELMDYHHAGMCTFEEAVDQFKHDAARMEHP